MWSTKHLRFERTISKFDRHREDESEPDRGHADLGRPRVYPLSRRCCFGSRCTLIYFACSACTEYVTFSSRAPTPSIPISMRPKVVLSRGRSGRRWAFISGSFTRSA